jgi:hypothetical protein
MQSKIILMDRIGPKTEPSFFEGVMFWKIPVDTKTTDNKEVLLYCLFVAIYMKIRE